MAAPAAVYAAPSPVVVSSPRYVYGSVERKVLVKKKARPSQNNGTVIVKAPRDAKMYVDGVYVPMKSSKRAFNTPKIKKGRKYYYTVKLVVTRNGKKVVQKRKIYVKAGKKTYVKFGDMNPVSANRR
jgi:uncharacterized protein (TIGR03000 family)